MNLTESNLTRRLAARKALTALALNEFERLIQTDAFKRSKGKPLLSRELPISCLTIVLTVREHRLPLSECCAEDLCRQLETASSCTEERVVVQKRTASSKSVIYSSKRSTD